MFAEARLRPFAIVGGFIVGDINRTWPTKGSLCDYPGYARAVNDLAFAVLEQDPSCDWIVAAGDDTEPDMTKTADEIAAELLRITFMELHHIYAEYEKDPQHYEGGAHEKLHPFTAMARTLIRGQVQTFWGHVNPLRGIDSRGGSIDRICGPPWLGQGVVPAHQPRARTAVA